MTESADLSEASVPHFPRGVRLRFDEARQAHVLLAPERVIVPDEIAVEVLKLCDGQASVAQIVDALAARFDAPVALILPDVLGLLSDLASKGFVRG